MTTSTFGVSAWQGARSEQQDAVKTVRLSDGDLLVVADGVGSTKGAATASKIAVETFVETFSMSSFTTKPNDRLRHALEQANRAIAKHVDRHPDLSGMSTTITAAYITQGKVWWISVGDSILYLVQSTKLQRLNADHSVAGSLKTMAEKGLISSEAANSDAGRNQLTSVLSGQKIPHVDCPDDGYRLANGQQILVASDGLHSLSDEDILKSVTGLHEPQVKVESLIDRIKRRDLSRQDNVTIALSAPARAAFYAAWLQQASTTLPGSARPALIALASVIALGLVVMGIFGLSGSGSGTTPEQARPDIVSEELNRPVMDDEEAGSPTPPPVTDQDESPGVASPIVDAPNTDAEIAETLEENWQPNPTEEEDHDLNDQIAQQNRSKLRQIQIHLRDMNFDPGPTDGRMGQKTKTAIEALNQVAGRTIDPSDPIPSWTEFGILKLQGVSNFKCVQPAPLEQEVCDPISVSEAEQFLIERDIPCPALPGPACADRDRPRACLVRMEDACREPAIKIVKEECTRGDLQGLDIRCHLNTERDFVCDVQVHCLDQPSGRREQQCRIEPIVQELVCGCIVKESCLKP